MGKIRDELYNQLAEKPHPIFVFQNNLIPAATIWVGVKAWVNYFRELKLESGDRIILSYPESPAFVHIVFACIWEGLTLIILKPDSENLEPLEFFDAKLIITAKEIPYSIQPDNMGMPQSAKELRKTKKNRNPEIRFILQSSGSTGHPKFICLAEDAVFNVIETHAKIFESNKNSVLSALPWSHCFGLVLDLLLCTFYSEVIIRDSEGGRSLDNLFENFKKYEINHFSSVPLLIERILQKQGGLEFLQNLSSGIIGGAPISSMIADKLKNSKLSIGYGQTEASPGICLGEKGKIFANYIGNPLGCDTKISEDGELFFRGKNAFLGYWQNRQISIIPKNEWVPTGDMVEKKAEGLFFVGRINFSFKLSNGLMIHPEPIEKDLLEKNKLISHCMLFFQHEIQLIFSQTSSGWNEEEVIASIRDSIHPLLKKTSITIKSLPSHDWVYSAKGEINRIAMQQKLK